MVPFLHAAPNDGARSSETRYTSQRGGRGLAGYQWVTIAGVAIITLLGLRSYIYTAQSSSKPISLQQREPATQELLNITIDKEIFDITIDKTPIVVNNLTYWKAEVRCV